MTISQKTQAFIFSIFILFLTTIPTYAANTTFSWTANAETVSGYKIHYGTSSRNYNLTVDVGLPKTTNGVIVSSVDGLQEGHTYYFAATAYTATEESDYSVEVIYAVPGTADPEPPVVSNTDDIINSSPEENVAGSNSTISAETPAIPSDSVHTFPDGTINDFALEAGELLVTSDWQHVDFKTEFSSPALVAKLTTTDAPDAGLVTIRNLNSKGFDIRIGEWNYEDGYHSEEIVSFMAMERGHHQVADNVHAIAECFNTSGINAFEPVNFTNALPSQPVIISSIVTNNGSDTTALRMKDITSQGFSITMQEQESNDWSHTEETVCFIATQKWSGVIDNLMFEVGATPNTLTDKPSTLSFKQQFPSIPFTLADMQSTNGTDPAILGMSNLSVRAATLTVFEEQSADSELGHVPEIGGYFAVAPVTTLATVATTDSIAQTCTLESKFKETTMQVGAQYYTDRSYTITGGIPDWMEGSTLIRTGNDEKLAASASGYLSLTNSGDYWVYVLFDSRSVSVPSWLNGWELQSDIQITTSLSTQPYLKVYRKQFSGGQCVDLGGNYGPGSSAEYRSNYVVVYRQ